MRLRIHSGSNQTARVPGIGEPPVVLIGSARLLNLSVAAAHKLISSYTTAGKAMEALKKKKKKQQPQPTAQLNGERIRKTQWAKRQGPYS